MDEVDLMAFGDEQLVAAVYAAADAVEADEARDELYFVVDEVLERWAPEALKRARCSELEDVAEKDDFLAAVDVRAAWRPLAQELGG
jgi:hypothetical protein